MKKQIFLFFLSTLLFLLIFNNKFLIKEKVLIPEAPNDWFIAQRIYPNNEIKYDILGTSIKKNNLLKKQTSSNEKWKFVGPTNIGGRITDVEMNPNNNNVIYAGAASGGVFKTTNKGISWEPIFDDALSLSIGDLAIDPKNTETIYVGTGEVNGGGGSLTYGGMGIYKSTNGGDSWNHLGLENTRYISRIVINPNNPNVLFVGAMGKLFAKNEDRGIYRSTDGGATFNKVFYINSKTGCIDLVIDPINPNIIYAAMWERIRTNEERDYGGENCGIYKSDDGGNSWYELTNGLPVNTSDKGRIGLAISKSNPNILYNLYLNKKGLLKGYIKQQIKERVGIK